MRGFVVGVGLVALAVGPAFALDRYVAPGGSHTPPFTSWGTAATNLNAAVHLANSNNAMDTVWVSNGTYVLSATVFVTNTIVRGFSGDPADVIVNGNATVRGFYLNHANAVVQDLTISNCVANANPNQYYGGGACVVTGTLSHCVLANNTAASSANGYGGGAYGGQAGAVISNCVFVTNYTGSFSGYGGGAYVKDGLVINCAFSNNVSSHYGGGVAVNGQGVVSNCTFVANVMPSTGGANGGGGVYIGQGTVASCLIVGNISNREGGGAYVNGTSAVLVNSTCSWNSARQVTYGSGGGVNVTGGLVTNCTIDNNYGAGSGGGGVYMGSTSTVVNCIITNNLTIASGGGVYCATLNGLVVNCLIAFNVVSNFSSFGGGLAYTGSRGIVQDCNISSNSCLDRGATGGGAGVSIGSSGLLLDRCTIAGNIGRCRGGGIVFNGLPSSSSTAQYCRITGNIVGYSSWEGGGGVMFYTGGGNLINCLIANNVVTNGAVGGGVAFIGNAGTGALVNCTVVSNNAANTGHGGGLAFGNNAGPVATGIVINCIVYSNRSSTALDYNWYLYNANSRLYATNSCTFPTNGILGSGNTADNPRFVNAAAGDYRLALNSPCVNAGLTESWMAGATDLDGRPRLDKVYHVVDMGAYECVFPGALVYLR